MPEGGGGGSTLTGVYHLHYTIKVSVIKVSVQTLCLTNIKATAVFERCLHYQIPGSKYTLITESVIVCRQ